MGNNHQHPPGLPLNCPLCGARLSYLLTLAGTLVYQCGQDGLLELPPAGIIRPAAREELQARIYRGDLIS
jgi:hypothetical protein